MRRISERFRIALPEGAIPFIPSAEKFLEYIGRPGGLAGQINHLARQHDRPVPDPKTLKKAVNEGVTPRIGEQIKEILRLGLAPEFQAFLTHPDLAPWLEVKLPHSGLAWLCMARGEHHRIFRGAIQETFTGKFIERRSEQELALLQSGQTIKESGASAQDIDEHWVETLIDFLSRRTRVSSALIRQALQTSAALKSGAVAPCKEQVGFVLSLYTRLRIDFYYQLLCNVSLDLSSWFKQKGDIEAHEHWLIKESFFGDMSPTLDGDRLMLPLERLLDSWRQGAAGRELLSWAEVAQRLPNPYGLDADKSRGRTQTVEAREATIRKNKQSRLREWRQGTRPAPEQLAQFVRNLFPKGNDGSLALMKAEVAVIWGAFIQDEWAVLEKYGLHEALRETLPAFESYPEYWAEYQSQAAKTIAA